MRIALHFGLAALFCSRLALKAAGIASPTMQPCRARVFRINLKWLAWSISYYESVGFERFERLRR